MANRFYNKSQSGFSLIEMLIVIGIVVLFTSILLYNYDKDKRGKAELERAAQALASDIREAQTRATASGKAGGRSYCGFGIHKDNTLNTKQYIMYGGLKVTVDNADYCFNDTSKQYNKNGGTRGGSERDDIIGSTRNLLGSNIEFMRDFGDIFYESPYPNVYLQNTYGVPSDPGSDGPGYYNGSLATPIVLRIKGTAVCNDSTCATICVFISGRVDIKTNNASCP